MKTKLKVVLEILFYLAAATIIALLLTNCATTAPYSQSERSRRPERSQRPAPGTIEIRSNHHSQFITLPRDTIIYYGHTLKFIIIPGADSFTAQYYEDGGAL